MNTDLLYFNTPANGRIDHSSSSILDEFYKAQQINPSSYFMDWMMNRRPIVKKRLADLVNCKVEEMALVPNSSFAISSFCQSLPKKWPVLMFDMEYPSLMEPFRLQGHPIHFFTSNNEFDWDYQEIEDFLVQHNIKVLAISHVQFRNGYCADLLRLGALCKKHGVLFMLDATQSAGAIPIDMQSMHIDVLVASNYKWMNAGPGTGFLAIKEWVIDSYPPTIGGFGSYVNENGNFLYKSSISSYEPGHLAIAGFLLLEKVLESRTAKRVKGICKHNLNLASMFRDGLEARNVTVLGSNSEEKYHSQIVSVDWDEDVWQELVNLGVACSARYGRIRFGFHHDNSETEIQEFFNRLDQSTI